MDRDVLPLKRLKFLRNIGLERNSVSLKVCVQVCLNLVEIDSLRVGRQMAGVRGKI